MNGDDDNAALERAVRLVDLEVHGRALGVLQVLELQLLQQLLVRKIESEQVEITKLKVNNFTYSLQCIQC